MWLNVKILKLKGSFRIKPLFILLFVLVFTLLYVLALRGPFRDITMNVNNYKFSRLESFNMLVLNPIMSFSFAHKQYKKERISDFVIADETQGQFLQERLFPLFEKSVKNELTQKPHIMLNLMESFSTQMLSFSSENFNLLGELEKHFKEDFVFERFLPFENGTAPSLVFLFLNSSKSLSKSQYNRTFLPLSPLQVFKKQGYKIIFLTAGNRAWFDMGEYMKAQGVDEVIDELDLMQSYEDASKNRFSYGVLDEFMYQKAYELLQNAKEPLLILSLSISNHPPYPKTKEYFGKAQIPSTLLEKIPRKAEKVVNSYVYANEAFGKFLSQVKQSELKDKLIIAATGDHRVRDLQSEFPKEQALSYGVPLYIYVPKPYQKDIFYDKFRVASHKDIFPTLYDLSLSEAEYLNLGGRNLLKKPQNQKYEFAYNVDVWLDEKGIYTSNAALSFENNQSLIAGDFFELDEEHKEFKTLYKKYLNYTLNLQLVNLQQKP